MIENSEEIDEGEDSEIINFEKSGERISDFIWMWSGSKLIIALVGAVVVWGSVLLRLIIAHAGGLNNVGGC